MGNSPNPVPQEKKNSPSLVENIKNVLNKNELYRPSSFNPSISSPNTINNAIGAMEQSKNLGASHSAAHGSNVYGNAFANTPKNLNEKAGDWNWREHTKEENIAQGIKVRDKQDIDDRKKLDKFRRENPDAYQQQLQDKAAGQERALTTVNANKRISPMYWVTQDDFKKATGEDYDARNAKHRQLFFDLNSSGESNVAPTAGVGQGPAYDSLAYHTMRRRPANIPQFGTPQARYDTVDGTIANTTSQSRGKAQWDADDAAALKRIDAEAAKRDAEIRAEARRIVGAEQKAAALKNATDTKEKRQGYIDQISDTLNKDGSRTIKEPIRGDGGGNFDVQLRDNNDENLYGSGTAADPIRYSPYVDRSKPGTGISDAQRSVTDTATNTLQDMMRSGSDWMKKQSLNSPGVRYPETGVNPDVNRGESPIYPEGQVDSTYRQPPGVGVSNIINNLVTSVGASGKNVAAELQRIMKLNTAQTNPNVIQDKLYGDISAPMMDTQAKTPSEPPAYSYTIPSPFNPDIKTELDAEDYNIKDDSESTGGMNEPMDLSDFPDKKETTSKPAGDYVKDIIKPFQDAADQQSTQDKINDILKNLGTSDSKKTSRRSKRKRKETTRVAMVGEAVVIPPPFFSGKELRTDLIGNPNPVPTFTSIGKGVANTVMNPVDSAKSAVNMAKKGVSAVEYAVKNPIPAATTVGKTALQVGGALVVPLVAGELARRGAELGTDYIGMDPATEMNELPNLSKEIQSVADWSAMSGAGQVYMNALRGAPLVSGLGTQLVSGAIGGALVPVVAYGGFKAGEALRDFETPQMLGLEVADKVTGKTRPKTYAETGEDIVNYVVGDSETDRAKEYRMRRGMPTQQEYAPEPTRYPSSAELEYHTRKERERNRNLATEIPSPMQSTTWDKVNKPSSGFVRAPKL